MEWMKSYIGILVTGGAVIVLGILVTQGLLSDEWADRALGFFLGAGGVGAVALRVTPKPTPE